MSCTNCSTKDNGVPKGCKSNGNCSTGGCEKLSIFDWLSNMTLPSNQKPFDIYEVRFKNGRKHFFRNYKELPLSMGDLVTVESSSGHDVGSISLSGELVKVQMHKKKKLKDSAEVLKIYRKSNQRDIDTWHKYREKEKDTQKKAREIIIDLGLKMKLSDVEYQGDGCKATFYYTADERVDFRQLVRDYASEFSIRIEMKQIGLRQEAARLGGIGSCGRELSCSTWLTEFRKVNTASARYQQLSLNPLKLAGQCGKLKCCLNYELDTYLDALKGFPKQDIVLHTKSVIGVFVKMDIFKKIVWYTYKDSSFKWYKLELEQVQEIIEANKNKETVASLEDFEIEEIEEVAVNFENAVGEDNINRFDKKKVKKNKRKRTTKNSELSNKNIKDKEGNLNISGNADKKNNDKSNRDNPNRKNKVKVEDSADKKNNKKSNKNKPNNKKSNKTEADTDSKRAANNEKANRNNPNYKPKKK